MTTIVYISGILLLLLNFRTHATDLKLFSLHDTLPANTAANNPSKPTSAPIPKKPELFNSGFLDFQNGGQMGASARVFRLFIGEPKKFVLPVSVYAGVSGAGFNNNSNNSRIADPMVMSIINPLSGSFNISIDYQMRFNPRSKKLTGFSWLVQGGEKMIQGQQMGTLKPFHFFTTYSHAGILFQTGAWERDKEKNMGLFWVLARYHAVRLNENFSYLSGFEPNKSAFHGMSLGLGIEINNVLNIKTFYYRYLDVERTPFDIPIFQFSCNYSMSGRTNQ